MDIINNIEQLTLKQAVGSQQLAVGSQQSAVGSRQSAMGLGIEDCGLKTVD